MMRYLDLWSILNAHYLGIRRNKGGHGVHQGSLTGSGFPRYPEIHTLLKNYGEVGRHLVIKGAKLNELQDAYRRIGEFTDSKVTASLGDIDTIGDIDT